jgi:hypothetical protein
VEKLFDHGNCERAGIVTTLHRRGILAS